MDGELLLGRQERAFKRQTEAKDTQMHRQTDKGTGKQVDRETDQQGGR